MTPLTVTPLSGDHCTWKMKLNCSNTSNFNDFYQFLISFNTNIFLKRKNSSGRIKTDYLDIVDIRGRRLLRLESNLESVELVVDRPELPRPARVVEEGPVIEPVVVRTISLGVVGRSKDSHLVSVDGVVPEEQLHLVRDLFRRAAVFPEKQFFCNAKKKDFVNIFIHLRTWYFQLKTNIWHCVTKCEWACRTLSTVRRRAASSSDRRRSARRRSSPCRPRRFGRSRRWPEAPENSIAIAESESLRRTSRRQKALMQRILLKVKIDKTAKFQQFITSLICEPNSAWFQIKN